MRRVLLATFALLAGSAPAQAALRPQVLAVPGSQAGSIDPPSIAVGADGTQAVAWRTQTRSWVAVRRPGARRFGKPIPLAAGTAAPHAVVLSGGRVLVVVVVNDGTAKTCCTIVASQVLQPRARRAGGLQPVSVRGRGVSPFALAVGGGGSLAAVVMADVGIAVANAAGRFAAPVTRPVDYGDAAVAVGSSGRGAALWLGGDRHDRLVGAPLARGRVGASRTLLRTADPGPNFGLLDVAAAADARGRVTVLLTRPGGFVAPAAPAEVNIGVTTAGGALRAVQTLDSHTPFGAGMTEPSVALTPAGTALAAWRAYDNIAPGGATQTVRIAARLSATSRFRVVASIDGATQPRVAVLPGGDGAVVYQPLGIGGSNVRRVRAGGALGAPQNLPGAAGEPGPQALAVATAATGRHRITLAYTTGRGLSVIDLNG